MSPILFILKILPKNLVSFATGFLVRLTFPSSLQNWLNKRFVSLFNIDIQEAEKALEDYKSIEDVFTRKLKKGNRPIDNTSYSSPCDGILSLTQELEGQSQNSVFQIKGFSYSFSELIGTDTKQNSWSPSLVSTFYLAPHNYHRVHSPLTGKIKSLRHIPGQLWPVNPKFLSLVPRLFARNERLVFEIDVSTGGTAYLVMVGAFNVGRITTPFCDDLTTNTFKNNVRTETLNPAPTVATGDEIGTFLMGSTVVLGLDKEALSGLPASCKLVDSPTVIKMGETLLT